MAEWPQNRLGTPLFYTGILMRIPERSVPDERGRSLCGWRCARGSDNAAVFPAETHLSRIYVVTCDVYSAARRKQEEGPQGCLRMPNLHVSFADRVARTAFLRHCRGAPGWETPVGVLDQARCCLALVYWCLGAQAHRSAVHHLFPFRWRVGHLAPSTATSVWVRTGMVFF